MAVIPGAGGSRGASQIPGHHPPQVSCSNQSVTYSQAKAIQDANNNQTAANIALALLGYASVQGIIAKALAQSISWVRSHKKATSVISTTISSFGLASAIGSSGTTVVTGGNYRVCEYKHLVNTNSDHWDSWTDYAHYAGQVIYKTTDLDTGFIYYSDAEYIAR